MYPIIDLTDDQSSPFAKSTGLPIKRTATGEFIMLPTGS
jgi:hypothetical protein